jgi:hypothetical protein
VRSLLLGLAFLPSEKEESQTLARALILSSNTHNEVCCLYVTRYVLVLFVSGVWYSSYSDTRPLYTRQHQLTQFCQKAYMIT